MDNKKIQAFIDEYGQLVKKHNVDFISVPQFVPNGKGGFEIVCTTMPFDLDEIKKESFMQK